LQFANLWLGGNNGSLPFPAANSSAFLQAEFFKGITNSIYHALQLNITKRLSHGFSLQGAYTYSHAIDFSDRAGRAGRSCSRDRGIHERVKLDNAL